MFDKGEEEFVFQVSYREGVCFLGEFLQIYILDFYFIELQVSQFVYIIMSKIIYLGKLVILYLYMVCEFIGIYVI